MNTLRIPTRESFVAIPFNFSLSPNKFATNVFTLNYGWGFHAFMMTSYSDGPFEMNVANSTTSEKLFVGGDIKGNLITGDGKQPFKFPTPFRFHPSSVIEVNVINKHTSTNNIQIVLIGAKTNEFKQAITPQTDKAKYALNQVYVIPFNFNLQGNTVKSSYPVSKDYDFLLDAINAYPFPPYSTGQRDFYVNIKDEAINEDFFTGPVRASLIMGSGQYPFYLPRPYIFRGGTTITMVVSDTGSSSDSLMPVQIILIGYKIRRQK
jgi:hypothetical protein